MSEALFVGVDWGHDHCQVVAENDKGEVELDERVATAAGSLKELVARLREVAKGRVVQVVIETTSGPVVQTLLGTEFEVYAVNPKKVDHARELWAMSGAKDDRRDARAAVWLLRNLPESVQRLSERDPLVMALRATTRRYQDTTEKIVGLRSQLRALAQEYYPALLQLGDFDTEWIIAVAQEVPSPTRAEGASEDAIRSILRRSRVRKYKAPEVLAILRQAAAPLAAPMVDANAFDLDLLCSQLQLLKSQHKALSKRMEGTLNQLIEEQKAGDELTDAEIIRSHPGAGAYVTATLIGEGLVAILKSDLNMARAYAGVAPVTSMTGKRQTSNRPKVTMRRACSTYIRRAMHCFGEKAMQYDPSSKARYAALRQRGHKHGRAIRQLGDTKLKQLRAMLRDRTAYCPSQHGWNAESST